MSGATGDTTAGHRRLRRSWSQRLTVVFAVVAALACFSAAGAIAAGQWVLSQRNLVTLSDTATERKDDAGGVVVADGTTDAPAVTDPAASTTSMVLAEPEAANFLVVGADNNDCADNPITEDRTDLGERSDTIMVWRANPDTNQLAVLSFPRDLYVEYPGGRQRRINEAFQRDDPSRLQEVIAYNFGIEIDHYVQIDFCAFRQIVDAVGGVEIPFEYPARDTPRDGVPLFLIERTGCVNLDGDTALAYVRSRHYQYEVPAGSGNWKSDPTSDFGRISRQQDFLRRMLGKVIDEGLYSPDVASALITTNRDYLTTDANLTLRRMLEFASALRNFDADSVATYRIESESANRYGASVEIPRVNNDNMRAILAIFRGEATLASAPDQTLGGTTATTQPTGTTTTTSTTTTAPSTAVPAEPGSTVPGAETTLPTVAPTENTLGVVPDRNVTC
jgi:LCP family protein required for cell wall assembly